MAQKEMYDYIATGVTADYTGATLSVTPTNVIKETGQFNQRIFWHDDGSVRVISHSPTTPQFFVEFEFQNMTQEDAGTVFDFWADGAKAYGSMRSIYYEHPWDGHQYVIRFVTPFSRSMSSEVYNRLSISMLKAIVEGAV